jgi:hypothetical protein
MVDYPESQASSSKKLKVNIYGLEILDNGVENWHFPK